MGTLEYEIKMGELNGGLQAMKREQSYYHPQDKDYKRIEKMIEEREIVIKKLFDDNVPF
jgi:hypothetical protein